ncbi:MAG: hypothetical protein AAF483_27495 [Planctomycetota bacterium]
MRIAKFIAPIVGVLAAIPVLADHHKADHAHGPKGGALVALGDGAYQVELLVQDGELVTARVLDKDKKPVAVDAANIILTFTEPDGEKEDYKIAAAKGGFQRKSDHVVHHIMRDKISIKLNVGGKVQTSKTFAYPHGPHGGELISLGESGHHAELVVSGDIVRIHLLNKSKRPVAVDAKQITLTFTEPDGELEDYQIPVGKSNDKGTVFERDDDHVVKHVKRDKIMIKLAAGGKTLQSKTFHYHSK